MSHKEANPNNSAVNRHGNNLRDLGNDRVCFGQIMVTQFRDHGNERKMLVTSIRSWAAMATCLASRIAMPGDGWWLHPNSEICQQNDHLGLVFDIICKFCEMEEKKYIFCVFYRHCRRFMVPFNADIRPCISPRWRLNGIIILLAQNGPSRKYITKHLGFMNYMTIFRRDQWSSHFV